MKFTFPPESKPLDGYTIKRGIHRGGFGEVYYALSDAGKEVALKLLQHNTDIELRGVRQCLNLKHPHLVAIFDIRTDKDGDHWIIMEFMAGKALDQVIQQYPQGLPDDLLKLWFTGVAAGMSFLHDRGIVHRDLKPANVYEDQAIIKIGDVGLSKFISQSRRGAQTQSVGTVYYMAPEVARGSYGKEVDIYALGVMLFEMLTGQVPFDGESTGEILMKHLSEKPDLTRVRSEFRPILAKALEKDPLKRYASIADFQVDVLQAFGESPPAVNAEPAAKPAAESPAMQPAEQPSSGAAAVADSPTAAGVAAAGVGVAASAEPGKAAGAAPAGRPPIARPVHTVPVAAAYLHRSWDELSWMERHGGALKAAVAVVVVFLLTRKTGINQSWSMIFLGAVILGGLVALSRMFTAAHRGSDAVGIGIPVKRRRGPHGVRRVSRHKRTHVRVNDQPTPLTPRAYTWSNRFAQLFNSLTMAAVITVLTTACLHLVTDFLPSIEEVSAFGFVTLIASWMILTISKLQEGSVLDPNTRRLALALTGLAIGAAGYYVDEYLLLDYSRTTAENYGMFQSVGQQDLIEHGTNQPTLAGYMVFFASLLGLRRWWWHADTFRSGRFRISSTVLTLGLAYVLTCIIAFPQGWGLLWAVAISCVVQLSAGWVPPEHRVVELADKSIV